MNSIVNIENCYGCGVCSVVCGKNIISITLNKEGFYEPTIEELDKCTLCGLCTDICAFMHEDLSLESTKIDSYAAWSNDVYIRRKCSSGGIGFEIGKQLIEQGYKVCAVKYNTEKQRAEHYMAATINELIPSIGSKYIQSYTVDGFKDINREDKYLITGTPCQIDSFRRYIRKKRIEDHFVLLDFFCHSVPSMHVWSKYLQIVEKTTGRAIYVSWRNKFAGWHDSWIMSVDGDSTRKKISEDSYDSLMKTDKCFYNSRLSQGDLFYKLFLGDFYCNKACRNKCKYKYRYSSADIRIGDLWGETYKKNEDGVSALVTFTPKGDDIIKCLNNCTLVKHPFEVVAEGQMKQNAKKAYVAWVAQRMLKSTCNYPLFVWKLVLKLEDIVHLPKRVLRKMRKSF